MKGKARSRQVRLTVCALALIVLLSLVAGCGGSAAGDDALIYNFTAGDSFTYDLKAVLNGNLNAPGMAEDEGQIPQDSTLEARFTMKVTDVTDEVATITYSYEKMSMTSEGKTEEMDLGSVPEVTAKVDKHGKIVSVEGADSGILGSFLGTNTSSSPIDPSQISGTSMVPFPTDAVEVGDEWTTTVEQKVPGLEQTVQVTTTAKLTALDELEGAQIATVDFTTTTPMDLEIDLGAIMAAMSQAMTSESTPDDFKLVMGMDGEESFSGTTRVNLSKGLPVGFEGEGHMKISVTITEAPEEMVPADQRGPYDIDMTMDITLEQVK